MFVFQANTPVRKKYGFPRSARLTRGNDLRKVLLKGKRLRSGYIDGRVVASLRRHVRVGIIVPKYQANAVARNRLKRRLRAIVRTQFLPVLRDCKVNVDVVLRAHPTAYSATFVELSATVASMGRLILGSEAYS